MLNEFDSTKLFLVGIAASAGGLEPMRDLLKNASCHGSMSFVVVSHLARYRESDLARILEKASHIRSSEIEEGMSVENCRLYTVPPNAYVTVTDSKFHLQLRPAKGPNECANVFFQSLAESYRANAIGVVLSGSAVGADGSRGVQAIKASGGHTFAQDPITAEYPQMPQLAIKTRCIDSVSAPEFIGHELSLISWSVQRQSCAAEHTL